MGCTMEHIAPQLLQAAGRQGDGILERQAAQGRAEPHENSRLYEEGILERFALTRLRTLLVHKGLWP